MEGANLFRAQMQGADLRGAQMEGVDLFGAQMQGADLSYSNLTGTSEKLILLASTNLSAVINNGGALRFMDLSKATFSIETDFRNAFIDGTSIIPAELARANGNPCQWVLDRALSEDEFFGRWRGWVEFGNTFSDPWGYISPKGFKDIPAIPPDDPDCRWKE